jgi:hypothetical protein
VVTAAIALEDLDRGGLASTIRAEQREDLAVADRQVDALDNRGACVGLHEAVNIHCKRAGRVRVLDRMFRGHRQSSRGDG